MNDRVKAILFAALRLAPSEREVLARTLLEHLETDLAVAELLFGAAEDSTAASTQPTTDVLARYLDS